MEIQDNTQNNGGGNTITPPKSMRRCCFTLNNPNNTILKLIEKICDERQYKYCIGEEVGESGTPHLQGYIEFPSPKTFGTIQRLLPGAHIERAKGTRKQNLTYCKKEGKFICSFPLPLDELALLHYHDVQWKSWQQSIIDLYHEEPDPRKVIWLTDIVGNKGKTFLTKYMVARYQILLVDGKKTDVFHQVAKRLESEDYSLFRMVIMDIPRHQQEYINYGCLEQLKNGLISSGKYEGGTFLFPTPHVVVMSNSNPDYSKFSVDRWSEIILN